MEDKIKQNEISRAPKSATPRVVTPAVPEGIGGDPREVAVHLLKGSNELPQRRRPRLAHSQSRLRQDLLPGTELSVVAADARDAQESVALGERFIIRP